MRFSPIHVYRQKIPDGAGGFTLVDIPTTTIFGAIMIDRNETTLLCGADEFIDLEDVVLVGNRHWRVMYRKSMQRAPIQSWSVALCDRPQVVFSTTTGAP